MSTLALDPVAAGVFEELSAPAITDLATGGIYDVEVPASAGFPRVWFTVSEENARGLGRGGMRKINLRVYGAQRASDGAEGVSRLVLLLAQVVSALEDASLTMDGYRMDGEIFYSDTIEPYDSVIAGVVCKEMASNFYFWVEPTTEENFIDSDWA